MFSRQPHAPQCIEIIYPGEQFTWQEDPAVEAERAKQRKRKTLTLIAGIVLAALVLGNAVGIAWFFSSVTEAKALFIPGPR